MLRDTNPSHLELVSVLLGLEILTLTWKFRSVVLVTAVQEIGEISGMRRQREPIPAMLTMQKQIGNYNHGNHRPKHLQP